MGKAIIISQTGGPEQLMWQSHNVGAPAKGEVKIRHTAIGLNYIDTYMRTGLYPMSMPGIVGQEAAGIITELGPEVSGLAVGDRVAYPGGPIGAYSEERVIPATNIVKVPDAISNETAAALLTKACTVEFLIKRVFRVEKHHTVLLHAAAGGVGLLACQWLSSIGATIIGTISGDEKAATAKANGCTHTINYRTENVAERVRDITGSAGVDVVYDSAGKTSFDGSINSLKKRGMMVSFGNTTGPVDPVAPGLLAQKGSLFLTRPRMADYVTSREDFLHSTAAVFEQITAGVLKATSASGSTSKMPPPPILHWKQDKPPDKRS